MLNRKPEELYYPCPKCGGDRLDFTTSIDCINSRDEVKLISSIICLTCFFQKSLCQVDSKGDVIEENRQNWNNMWLRKMKGKQNG